jgi:hypothetical protein
VYLSNISKELNEIKDKQLKELNEKDVERLQELIELNALSIQELYDFKLKVVYLVNDRVEFILHSF